MKYYEQKMEGIKNRSKKLDNYLEELRKEHRRVKKLKKQKTHKGDWK